MGLLLKQGPHFLLSIPSQDFPLKEKKNQATLKKQPIFINGAGITGSPHANEAGLLLHTTYNKDLPTRANIWGRLGGSVS